MNRHSAYANVRLAAAPDDWTVPSCGNLSSPFQVEKAGSMLMPLAITILE